MINLPIVSKIETDNPQQYITFKIGKELYGIGITMVMEVIPPRPVTAIPRTPKYLKGIINLRGEVISIIDLSLRFGLKPKEITAKSRIIVVMANQMKIGILVDAIYGIMTLNVDDLRRANMIVSAEKQKFISGSHKISEDSVLLILRQDKIINEQDFQAPAKIDFNPESLSLDLKTTEDCVKEIHLVGFSIQKEQYSIESQQVEEIIFLPETTPVPKMFSFVEGIFYLRKSVIPVIRLGERLGLGNSVLHEDTPVLIINIFNIKVGLIVDEITGVFSVKEEKIKAPPIHISKNQTEQLRGVIRLTRNNFSTIVMILKPEMLFSFKEQDLLKKLDHNHETVEIPDERDSVKDMSIFEFMLAGDRYAIEVSKTNEIIPIREIVPVPKAPPFIKGIINLRGKVISVVDLPKLVSHHDYQYDRFTKLLIVNTGNETIGLIVEKVLGIRKVVSKIFDPPSDILQQKSKVFIEGIGKDAATNDIIILMDIETTLIQVHAIAERQSLDLICHELEMPELEDKRVEQALLE